MIGFHNSQPFRIFHFGELIDDAKLTAIQEVKDLNGTIDDELCESYDYDRWGQIIDNPQFKEDEPDFEYED